MNKILFVPLLRHFKNNVRAFSIILGIEIANFKLSQGYTKCSRTYMGRGLLLCIVIGAFGDA